MAEFAATQRDARSAWLSDYPFETTNGGMGVVLSCTTSSGTSSRTALVGTGSVVMITNVSDVVAYIALGDSSVTATTAYFPILPGTKEILTLSGDITVTHAAGITGSSTATVLVHKGHGN